MGLGAEMKGEEDEEDPDGMSGSGADVAAEIGVVREKAPELAALCGGAEELDEVLGSKTTPSSLTRA